MLIGEDKCHFKRIINYGCCVRQIKGSMRLEHLTGSTGSARRRLEIPIIHHFSNGEKIEVADEDEEPFQRLIIISGEKEAIEWAKKRSTMKKVIPPLDILRKYNREHKTGLLTAMINNWAELERTVKALKDIIRFLLPFIHLSNEERKELLKLMPDATFYTLTSEQC